MRVIKTKDESRAMIAVDTYFQRTARDTRRTTTCLLVSVKMYTIVLVVTCFQHFVGESHCKSVLPARVTAHAITSVIDGESHHVNASQAGDWRDSDGQLSRTKTPGDDSIADNALLLVTVVKEHHTTGKGDTTFWVDGALLDMTVTVVVQGKGQGRYLLVDHRGKRPEALMSSRGNTVWTIHRPTAGQWRVVPERDGGYEVTVQGSSVLDVEVTLYDIDVRSGLAVLVHQSPTAGHQIRAIIDVIGADVMKNVYNMSLVTSDGVELASNWLRPAGGPQDPQFSTTFTWPTQAVFIRVYGQELGGDAFERQTSFIITPILIDLRLQQGEPSGADGSLVVRYELINNGQSDFFQLTAHVDNELFTAVVSPAHIRLGHLGSFDGSVTVSVPRYSTSKSGLLTVRVWSEKDPKLIQSADLLLTSPHTVTDLDPPYCRTLSMTGNCTRRDVTSPTCRLRHWVARASVEDDVSGLREVTFAEVTASDTFHVDHFLEGLAGRPVAGDF
ncbi:uncharacterized protein LOC143290292 [Babylonia areolata]|uniref:uncharacterized protein LOC143290292 n=1 Tax=Babylonia areolata TaxID=304850 RepID=UPI003FD597BA